MNSIHNLLELLNRHAEETQEKKPESDTYTKQREKCIKLYEKLIIALTEEQREQLNRLDTEYFILSGIWQEESQKEGFTEGFKLSTRLILDSLQS